MKPVLAALALLVSAGPISALSCLQPTVQQAFTFALEAEDTYLPVIGSFSGFPERVGSKGLDGQNRQFVARFTGHSITASGKGRALEFEVSVTEECIASWCPSLPADTRAMTFLQRTNDGYAFTINACYGNYFPEPGDDQLRQMRKCLKDMGCSASNG